MKIEAGKYYKTRDGRKAGPMQPSDLEQWPWKCTNIRRTFTDDGRQSYKIKNDSNADLIAEWTDTTDVPQDSAWQPDTPKLWRDMTPAEKGALLLAHHEGKVIEALAGGVWMKVGPLWSDINAYRVKPADPVVEAVTLYGRGKHQWTTHRTELDEFCISLDFVDGKPDPSSIRMEEL